jgi:hypothetical protein
MRWQRSTRRATLADSLGVSYNRGFPGSRRGCGHRKMSWERPRMLPRAYLNACRISPEWHGWSDRHGGGHQQPRCLPVFPEDLAAGHLPHGTVVDSE